MINSKLANLNAQKSELKQTHYDTILKGLNRIKSGNTTQISNACKLRSDMVHKRLSEMEALGMIYKTPYSSISAETNQRQAIWCLRGYELKFEAVEKKKKVCKSKK